MHHSYLDDLTPGVTFVTRAKTLSEAEILDFAFQFDPQPFHIDKEYAKDGPFGGLIASGAHTMAIAVRMLVQSGAFAPEASLGSPGFDELKFLRPVRPDDTLHAEGEVLDVRPSRSKPDRGSMRYRLSIINQRGEEVLSMIGTQLLLRQPAGAIQSAAGKHN